MKFITKTLGTAAFGLALLATAPAAHAQININIAPPNWGPAVPAGQQYYYIPETNGFYDVPARQYVVSRNGRWIRTTTLDGYDPANFHPVIVDYVGAQPWVRYDEYRVKYPRRGGNPHGMPPGQAKKMYRDGYREGRYDDRHEDDRRDNDRRDDDRDDDDRGKHGGKHGEKGHGRGHDRD